MGDGVVRQRQRRWETQCGVLALDAVVRFRGELCRGKWNAELDDEDLRTFVEVADAGGVSPAALRLGVSKSIVSRRLVRLEEELGVQLLTRSTRGLRSRRPGPRSVTTPPGCAPSSTRQGRRSFPPVTFADAFVWPRHCLSA
ncbi:helix-turn-helix domain-containing protein [Cystobacter fuscus]